MADLATLGLKIDATGAIKGISDTESRLESLGKKAASVGKAAGAALGAAFVGGAALVIKNTIEAEQAFAQLEQRVKSTGGAAGFSATELANIAGELQAVSTFGDDAIQSMQAVLLTFTQVRGDQFTGATEAVLDMATALGMDLQSAALQVGKALNDPAKGVAALARAGVQLTESQKAAVEQMVAVGDIAGAQTVILKELETQFGGSAQAARNTLGGALAALKNAFGDLFEVPEIVAPITGELNRLVDYMASADTIGAVKQFIKDTVAAFLVFGSTVADVVGVVATSLGKLAGFFGKLSGANSPLNKFARGMDSVAEGAAAASVKLEGMADAVAQATPRATAAVTPLNRAIEDTAELSEEAAEKAEKLAYDLDQLRRAMSGLTSGNTAAGGQGVVEIFGPITQQVLTGSPVEVTAVPSQQALTAWESFFGQFAIALNDTVSSVSTNLGDALLSTFSRIAQRGKATIGDIFATLGQTGLANMGGGLGGQVLGAGAIIADLIGGARKRAEAAMKLVTDQVDALADSFESFTRSFTPATNQFLADLQRIADFTKEKSEEIDNILTITARRALNRTGGDVDAALADLRGKQARREAGDLSIPNMLPAIAQLEAFKKATDDLAQSTADATKRAQENQRQRREEFGEDLEVRRLRAMGLDEEADAMQRAIANQRELDDVRLKFGDATAELVAGIQQIEEAARKASEEAQRLATIAGLDAQIARASGNEAEATRIEREQILLGITDETIRAKYEELWAIQDMTKAQQEAAEAAELLYQQQMKMEDLEVRRLIATGDAIAAEKLRFDLAQQRELRQAEKDFAMGLITEEIYEKLKEILDLEAADFANQQAQKNQPGAAMGPSQRAGGTTPQAVGSLATAQVQDIDRVVGELTTIRIRAGQLVQLMTRLVNGGGILGAVNAGLQASTDQQRLYSGDVVVA